jgi:arsenate reductase (thioredoxin)
MTKPRVLFLCIGNSCRSQMAEGLLRHLGGDRFEVHSAGIVESYLRPETVASMREIGIDISGQYSKEADVYAGQPFDVVVTTCDEAKEVCPLFPGAKRTVHWSIPDPVGRGPAAYRAARDQLKRLIEAELLPG